MSVTGLLALLALAVALLAFFGIGFATGERLPFAHDHFGSDIWHQNLPFRAFYQRELAEGRLPFWCPEFGTGYPLFAEGQVGALYPPNLLLHGLLPLPTAFNLSILLSMALAGTFTAMYARQLGAGRGPAIFAGLVFGLSGWYLMHLRHGNYTAAAAWAPLLLLLLERIGARGGGAGRRTIALLALSIGVMHLAGCPQIAYYNLLLGSLYALLLALRRGGWRDRVRPLAAWFGAVAIGFLLAAPQLLPSLELKNASPRREGLSLEKASFQAMAPRHLLLFVAPKAFGDHADFEEEPLIDPRTGRPATDPETGRPIRVLHGFETRREGGGAFPWEVTGYVGILPLLLAAAAIALSIRTRAVAWCAGLLALSVVLALGPSGGLYTVLFRVLPGFDWFRVFGRFLVYVDLFVAVLAALGLTRLLIHVRGRWWIAGVVAPAAAGLLFLADIHGALGNQHSTVAADHWLSPPATVRAIRSREGRGGEPFRIATIDPRRRVFRNAHVRAGGWTKNLERYEPVRLCVAPNMGILFGLSTAQVYTPLPLPWVKDAMKLLPYDADPRTLRPGGHNPRISALLNVRYVIDPFGTSVGETALLGEYPGDVLLRGQVLLPDGPPYRIRLLADPAALPRAYLAGGARIVPDTPAAPGTAWTPAQRALLSAEWDPRREVLITESDPAPAEGEPGPVAGNVRFLSYGPTRVVIETGAERDAWLFLGDSWYPGWTATVSGRETPIRRANLYGRAVRVPAGPQEVVFTCHPAGFDRGLLLAGVALALLAGLVAPWPKRRRARGTGDRIGAP